MTVPISRDPLTRLAPPRASEALRKQVLESARLAASLAPPPSRTDRVWFSRRWRLAWAASLAAAILVEFVASRQGGDAIVRPTAAIERESDAAAAELGLPGRVWIGKETDGGDSAPPNPAKALAWGMEESS